MCYDVSALQVSWNEWVYERADLPVTDIAWGYDGGRWGQESNGGP